MVADDLKSLAAAYRFPVYVEPTRKISGPRIGLTQGLDPEPDHVDRVRFAVWRAWHGR